MTCEEGEVEEEEVEIVAAATESPRDAGMADLARSEKTQP